MAARPPSADPAPAGKPHAHISHSAAGRVRIRVPGRRYDAPYFARVEQRFRECPGVERVAVNPMTGSILIEHTTDTAAITDFAEQGEFLSLQADLKVVPLGATLRAGVSDLDSRVRRAAGGAMDLWSAMAVFYIALACIQALRGQYMGPASTLLWTGLSAMRLAWDNSGANEGS